MSLEGSAGQTPTILNRPLTPAGTITIYDFFQSPQKIAKTSQNRENPPESLDLMLVYRNCSVIVAKFKFKRLSVVGV